MILISGCETTELRYSWSVPLTPALPATPARVVLLVFFAIPERDAAEEQLAAGSQATLRLIHRVEERSFTSHRVAQ